MYLFQIIDEGLIKRVIGRQTLEELKPLVSEDIKQFLDENGFEGTTEDGYAKIIKIDLLGVEEEDHLWSYSFDGEESIEDSVLRIQAPKEKSYSGKPTLEGS